MRYIRITVLVIHIAALIAGAVLCLWGLTITVRQYGGIDNWINTIERGGISFSLLFVTAVYMIILLKKGFSFLALPLYGTSFVTLGFTLLYWIRGFAKGFAPQGYVSQYVHGILFITLAVAVTLAFAVVAYRSASKNGITSESSGFHR